MKSRRTYNYPATPSPPILKLPQSVAGWKFCPAHLYLGGSHGGLALVSGFLGSSAEAAQSPSVREAVPPHRLLFPRGCVAPGTQCGRQIAGNHMKRQGGGQLGSRKSQEGLTLQREGTKLDRHEKCRGPGAVRQQASWNDH